MFFIFFLSLRLTLPALACEKCFSESRVTRPCTAGSAKKGNALSLNARIQLTSRLSVFGHLEYDTSEDWMWMTDANFILGKTFGIMTTYDSNYGFGAGLSFHF